MPGRSESPADAPAPASRSYGSRARALATALAASLLVGVAVGAMALAAGPAPVPPTFYGVVSQTQLTAEDIARMGTGNVGTLRLLINWGTIDPTQAADNNWSAVDPVVAEAIRNGIQPLPFIFGTPTWVAQGLDGHQCAPETCGLYAPRQAAAVEEWKRFLGEAVARYGPGGEFFALNPDLPVVPITTWQIWNEQNSKTFYRPKPDPNAYGNLIEQSAAALRAADPTAKVLLGGMFGTPHGEDSEKTTAWGYLKRFYRRPGISDYFEGVAAHPYSARMTKVKRQLKLIHDEIVRAGDTAAELWITEVGWSSGTGKNPLERGKQGQAARLRQAFNYFLAKRNLFKIQNVTWFAWRDLAGKPICQWCGKAGLFKANALTEKPAWGAFTAFTGGS